MGWDGVEEMVVVVIYSASAAAFGNDEVIEDGDGETVPFAVVKDAEGLGSDRTTTLVQTERFEIRCEFPVSRSCSSSLRTRSSTESGFESLRLNNPVAPTKVCKGDEHFLKGAVGPLAVRLEVS